MEDWGEIRLEQIDDSINFWFLYDELLDDKSGFLNNRTCILDAYKNGNLYGLRVNETYKMFEKGESQNDIFCKGSLYLLPCFCIKENNKAVIIWTHTRARKKGFAKCLVKLLDIKYAYNPLPDSIDFWKKCNVDLNN
tara:strand:- start:21369 stop:21779 length:411 start_codon:yes stop_codon:yes gene_type:complete